MGHLVSLAAIYEFAILTWYLLYVLLVQVLMIGLLLEEYFSMEIFYKKVCIASMDQW